MNDIIVSFLAKLSKINPHQAKYAKRSLEMLDNNETELLSRYISFYDSILTGVDGSYACYDFLCKEMLREEIIFKKNKAEKYRLSSQNEANAIVYSNDDYMKNYMIGLGISTFLWVNHLMISRYFKENLPKEMVGNYLEVGTGHGQSFSDAIRICKFDKYIGYDISEFSLMLTDETVKFMCPGMVNYKLVLGDFTSANVNGRFDAIICGEVLEHIEDPLLLLKKFCSLANNGAFIYITTAINSPAVDHIHLFRNLDEVLSLFYESGLEVESKLVLPQSGASMEEAIDQKLTLNVAFVLRVKD